MADECIVLVKQETLVCVAIDQARISDMIELAFDVSFFKKWLINYPGQGLHIVLDVLEEEVYIEDSPMLFAWEQKDYALRQMRKRFPKTEFCQSRYETQSAMPWESRSGFLLLTGLNEDARLKSLLDWCEGLEVPVHSIYSSALLLPELFRFLWFDGKRAEKSAWQQSPMILLAKTDENTFRQILMVNGHLRTSRQFLLKEQSTDLQLQQLVQEIRLFDKFVRAQKMLNYNEKTTIYYLGLTEQDKINVAQVFSQSSYNSDESQFLSLEQTALGLYRDPRELRHVLPIISFHHRLTKSDYWPAVVKEFNQYQLYAKVFWAGLFFALLFSAAYVMYFMVMNQAYDAQLKNFEQEHQRFRQSYETLEASLKLEVPIEHLKSSVDLSEHVLKKQSNQAIVPYLLGVSEALKDSPSVHIKAIHWSPTLDANFEGVKLDSERFGIDLTANIVVDAKVPLKKVLSMLDRFVLALQAIPSVSMVEFIQKPVDLDSTKQMTVKAEEIRDVVEQVFPFKLRLVFTDKVKGSGN